MSDIKYQTVMYVTCVQVSQFSLLCMSVVCFVLFFSFCIYVLLCISLFFPLVKA